MKISIYHLKGKFKGVLFISATLIIILLLLHSQRIVNQLRTESRNILQFYANLYASAASEETSSNLNFIFEEIILRTNFPIIQTDPESNPIAWKGIEIESNDQSPEAIEKVKGMVEVMRHDSDPIPLKYQEIMLGYLYYGDSNLITQLQMLPYIGISVVSLFVLIGFLGFRSIQKSEQQFIWVGMSKETAHQIGTPLSSLMGWLELLKSKAGDKDTLNNLKEMGKDIERLNRITARFSQIGSPANLKDEKIASIISNVVKYFKSRLPQWGKQVNIVENYHVSPTVALNKDLFEWVIENLLKNAIDAIEKDVGRIEINLNELKNSRHSVCIDISDNGRGIDTKRKSEVFKPGYSTKKRGWGLGLSLAKRIIEQYHGGKLTVKESSANQGTTMRILL